MSINQKDGGERCDHGFPVDMFEPELTDKLDFDGTLAVWICLISIALFASSFLGLVAGLIYGYWLR